MRSPSGSSLSRIDVSSMSLDLVRHFSPEDVTETVMTGQASPLTRGHRTSSVRRRSRSTRTRPHTTSRIPSTAASSRGGSARGSGGPARARPRTTSYGYRGGPSGPSNPTTNGPGPAVWDGDPPNASVDGNRELPANSTTDDGS